MNTHQNSYNPYISIPSHLIWGILTTLFCCLPLPLGIVSIIYAAQVNGKVLRGDIQGAISSSKKAKWWAIISAVLSLVSFMLLFGLGVLGAFVEAVKKEQQRQNTSISVGSSNTVEVNNGKITINGKTFSTDGQSVSIDENGNQVYTSNGNTVVIDANGNQTITSNGQTIHIDANGNQTITTDSYEDNSDNSSDEENTAEPEIQTAPETPHDPNKLSISYQKIPPTNVDLNGAYTNFNIQSILGNMQQLNMVNSTRHLTISAEQCNDPNAFYRPDETKIVMCYEFIQSLGKQAIKLYPNDENRQNQYMNDAAHFVFLHELGHAFVDILDIPVLGREEDAVDQFSILVMLSKNEEPQRQVDNLVSISQWFLSGTGGNYGNQHYADEHSLNEQRYFNAVCIVYGSKPDQFGVLVDKLHLPQARATRCPGEYQHAIKSWKTLFENANRQ